MKFRTDFVTNSSDSSFLTFNILNTKLFEHLAEMGITLERHPDGGFGNDLDITLPSGAKTAIDGGSWEYPPLTEYSTVSGWLIAAMLQAAKDEGDDTPELGKELVGLLNEHDDLNLDWDHILNEYQSTWELTSKLDKAYLPYDEVTERAYLEYEYSFEGEEFFHDLIEVQNGITEYSDLSGEDEEEDDEWDDEDPDDEDELPAGEEETAGIEKLTIPDGVTVIANREYRNSRSLKSVTIPGSVKSIGHMAFENCTKLQRAEFSEGLEKIGIQAFSGCTSLTRITLPESLRVLGLGAFYECDKLSEINIPTGVTEIKRACFTGSVLYNDPKYRENGALYIDGCLIEMKNTFSGSYKVREGTRLIAASAFWDCSRITEIIIPDSVEYIDDYAFGQCGNLAAVTLPEHLKRIGDAAFWKCRSLANEKGMTIIRGALYDYSGSERRVTVPGDVVCIEASAFDSNSEIETIIIENGVTTIKGADLDIGAFYNCRRLKDVYIPESVRVIEEYAFAGSSNVVIHAPAGSFAEQFAKKNGIKFAAE